MSHRLLLMLLSLLVLAGCDTDCDNLCDEMADYWDDCGLDVGDTAVKDCKDSWDDGADPIPGDAEGLNLYEKYGNTCRQLIAKEENSSGELEIALRARFTCVDMCKGPGGTFSGPGGGVDCDNL